MGSADFRMITLCVNVRKVTLQCLDHFDWKALVAAIKNWPLLQYFTLEYSYLLDDYYLTPIIHNVAQLCRDLHSLVILTEPLDKDTSELKDALLKLIKLRGPTLTQLVLKNIHCVDDEVLIALASAFNLKILEISLVGVTGVGVPYGMWPKIRNLQLYCNNMTNAWLRGMWRYYEGSEVVINIRNVY